MLVSLSPRATQQILLRSCAVASTAAAKSSASSSAAGGIAMRGLLLRGRNTAVVNQVAARLFYSTCTRARPSVNPQVRQRRPTVRGETIAFHVKDLANGSSPLSRLAHHGPAAALQTDYDDDEDDFLLDDEEAANKRSAAPAREYESDMIVVLDMDECLIHSQFLTNNPGAKFYAHQVARNSKDENGESVKGRVETFRFHLPDGDLVQVNMRPFLEEFLQEVTSKYETHIYTAAMKVYAEPILDKLDPRGDRFAQRWYRESCDLDKNMGAYVKNLGSLPLQKKTDNKPNPNLSYEEYLRKTNGAAAANGDKNHHLRRVVLVDNNPLSFLANPTNGILVSSFYNDPADKTLPAVLDLLQELVCTRL
mgnify:CR=1 FL=1